MGLQDDLKEFCTEAQKLGAVDAIVIAPKDVVTGEWVRLKCQFGCGGYGERLTCPPYSPTPETTRKLLDGFQHGILVHGNQWTDIKNIVAKLERTIFLAGYYKAFAMGSGPCALCEECDTEGSCRHPEEARPAMEACGIDVYASARKHGFDIRVLKSHDEKPNYFGLVLVE